MTTYSISLDDVDLALLPLRSYKYNDFLKKEQYQFQVMKTEEVEEPEPTIFYKCHICATDVPAAYAREHAASIKHRANARIASVAAQRTCALISALPPPTAPQTSRFCANCSAIVGRNHEKTKKHRVAVMHDKLLWELMTAYVSDDCRDDSDSFSDADDFMENENVRNSGHNGFAMWNEVNNNEEDRTKKFEQKLSLMSIESEKVISKEDKETERQNKDKHLDNKIKSVSNIETPRYDAAKSNEVTNIAIDTNKSIEIDRTTSQVTPKKHSEFATLSTQQASAINTSTDTVTENKITAKNDQDIATPTTPKAAQDKIEYVEFATKDNKTVKVYSDYYHSFTRKGDTINCKVCNISFNNNEVDTHMFSLKHLNQMPSALINGHCVRKIDEAFSHCILCNAMIKRTNLVKHYLTVGHCKMEKLLVTQNTNHTQATFKKPNTPLVTANTNQSTPEVKVISQNEKSIIDWPVIYPYETSDHGVRCVICDCNVPNNPENRKGHLVGSNHVKNVQKKREMQLVKLDYPYEATKQASIARCVICDTKVTTSRACLKQHKDGRIHAMNENNEKMTVLKAFAATTQDSVSRCIVCDIKVSNTLRNLLDHLLGSNHIKREANKRASLL